MRWDKLLGRMSISATSERTSTSKTVQGPGPRVSAWRGGARGRGVVVSPVCARPRRCGPPNMSSGNIRRRGGRTRRAGLCLRDSSRDAERVCYRSAVPVQVKTCAEPIRARPHANRIRTGGIASLPSLPFANCVVLDLGHGGVGVEVSRMLGDYGADVTQVETRHVSRLHSHSPRPDESVVSLVVVARGALALLGLNARNRTRGGRMLL